MPEGAGASNGGRSVRDLERGEGTAMGRLLGCCLPPQQPAAGSSSSQAQQQPATGSSSSHAQQQQSASGSNLSSSQAQHQQPQVVPKIAKVREPLRRAAGEYLFEPLTMQIGPYHQTEGFYSFTSTEKKKEAVQRLRDLGVHFKDLESALAALGLQVWGCYSHLPDDQYVNHQEAFLDMLLHDGCYLLNLLIEYYHRQQGQQGGAAGNLQGVRVGVGRQGIDNTIVRDILYLLENQMPLFVLDRMHRIIGGAQASSALQLIAVYVEKLLQKQRYISEAQPSLPPGSKFPDLLHLVHSYFKVGRPPQEDSRQSPTGRWRRATDYSRYANLQFKRRKFEQGDKWSILDIDLQGGTLYIPLLQVGSSTWTMLRNMMALEEQQEKRPVTAYCYFMSQLACREADVDLLQRADILEHFLGSNEQAAQGFAELCNGMALDMDMLERNYLKPFWHDLDKRSRKPVCTIMGFFRQECWSNEFYCLAFCVAVFVFLCQLAQLIYAVIAYHRPPKPR